MSADDHRERRVEAAEQAPAADPKTPADRYAELFVDVQMSRVFDDGKTFVDCAPCHEPQRIVEAYRRERGQPGFDLKTFVHANFRTEPRRDAHYVSDPDQSMRAHIVVRNGRAIGGWRRELAGDTVKIEAKVLVTVSDAERDAFEKTARRYARSVGVARAELSLEAPR